MERRNNRRWKTTKVGRQIGLSAVEATSLKYYIDYIASINHTLSIAAAKVFAWVITKKSDCSKSLIQTQALVINGSGTSKKRLNLTNRKPDNVDRGRSRMANMTVFKERFNLLEETINRLTIGILNLRNKSSSKFNCDASMIAMVRRTGKVVLSRKAKQVYAETKGVRDRITVNARVSASGSILPPYIIFQQVFPSGPYA